MEVFIQLCQTHLLLALCCWWLQTLCWITFCASLHLLARLSSPLNAHCLGIRILVNFHLFFFVYRLPFQGNLKTWPALFDIPNIIFPPYRWHRGPKGADVNCPHLFTASPLKPQALWNTWTSAIINNKSLTHHDLMRV